MPKLVYQALDGEIFNTEKECADYENKALKAKVLDEVLYKEALVVKYDEAGVDVDNLFEFLNNPDNEATAKLFLEAFKERLSCVNRVFVNSHFELPFNISTEMPKSGQFAAVWKGDQLWSDTCWWSTEGSLLMWNTAENRYVKSSLPAVKQGDMWFLTLKKEV